MLAVRVTEVVDTYKECAAEDRDEPKTNKHVYAQYIEYGEYDEECDQADGEVTNVLGFESFELNRLVDPFVDCVDT